MPGLGRYRDPPLRPDRRHRPDGGARRPRRLRQARGGRQAERAEGTTFFVHSGDTLSPSLLSGIDKGAHQIDILNQMGVDVMTPGNHEFDFGADNFRTRIGEAKFPIVTSNVREPGRRAAREHGRRPRWSTVGDVKIGFYGLTTAETPEVSSPGDITFADEIETAKKKQAEPEGRRRRFRRRRRAHAASPRTWRSSAKVSPTSCSPATMSI